MLKIIKDDKHITYLIIIKPIKHVYFRIKNQILIVSKNKHIDDAVIRTYILTNFDKIHAKTSAKKIIEEPETLLIFGKKHQVKYQIGHQFQYEINEQIVSIFAQDIGDSIKLKQLVLLDQLKQKTQELDIIIKPIIEKEGIHLLPYNFKWLKSKYGSYHRINKVITLNIFLATIETKFLTYVLLHEYAHVKVFNHQKPFYDLLDKMIPGHKLTQKALKKHHI